jgi:hypothetical protein
MVLDDIEQDNLDTVIEEVPQEIIVAISIPEEITKQDKQKKLHYIDDVELTALLMKEIHSRSLFMVNNPDKKPPGASNALGEWYIRVVDRLLTRGNFRGYSENYKMEFRSSAYLFFARYWYKFDSTRVQSNQRENSTEIKGGFSYFTTLAWTSILGTLKDMNLDYKNSSDMVDNVTKTSSSDAITEYYTGRNYVNF